jgi:hypothetical protein
VPLYPRPLNPLERGLTNEILETGVRSIDTLLTLARGQRIGIFSGAGVGKSTLLRMIARHVQSDVAVIALVGERGREVKSFVEKGLTPDARKRTVVVAATSDEPPLVRRRAAFLATAIAEHFRTRGLHVCLAMDSITRVAMAQREIGLASGELPTSRGYTPSVFSLLTRLLERGGVHAGGGTLTAIYTVLVDGDDLNDPIADSTRDPRRPSCVASDRATQRVPAVDIIQREPTDAGDRERRRSAHDRRREQDLSTTGRRKTDRSRRLSIRKQRGDRSRDPLGPESRGVSLAEGARGRKPRRGVRAPARDSRGRGLAVSSADEEGLGRLAAAERFYDLKLKEAQLAQTQSAFTLEDGDLDRIESFDLIAAAPRPVALDAAQLDRVQRYASWVAVRLDEQLGEVERVRRDCDAKHDQTRACFEDIAVLKRVCERREALLDVNRERAAQKLLDAYGALKLASGVRHEGSD